MLDRKRIESRSELLTDTPQAVNKFMDLLNWKYDSNKVRYINIFKKNVVELEQLLNLSKWDIEMLITRNRPMASINNDEYSSIKKKIKTLLDENRKECQIKKE